MLFTSERMPEMPTGANTGYMCGERYGVGAIDPVTFGVEAGGGIINAAGNIFGTIQAGKIAKVQEKTKQKMLKAQQDQLSREAALDQAQSFAAPYASARRNQVIALWAIGGLAAIIALGFVTAAVRKGGS